MGSDFCNTVVHRNLNTRIPIEMFIDLSTLPGSLHGRLHVSRIPRRDAPWSRLVHLCTSEFFDSRCAGYQTQLNLIGAAEEVGVTKDVSSKWKPLPSKYAV